MIQPNRYYNLPATWAAVRRPVPRRPRLSRPRQPVAPPIAPPVAPSVAPSVDPPMFLFENDIALEDLLEEDDLSIDLDAITREIDRLETSALLCKETLDDEPTTNLLIKPMAARTVFNESTTIVLTMHRSGPFGSKIGVRFGEIPDRYGRLHRIVRAADVPFGHGEVASAVKASKAKRKRAVSVHVPAKKKRAPTTPTTPTPRSRRASNRAVA